MDIQNDLFQPTSKARSAFIAATIFLALGAAACSSNADVQAVDSDDSTGSEFVGAEQVESIEEEIGEPSEELAFADSDDNTEDVDDSTAETTAPEATTTTTEAPDLSPVFGEEPDVTHLKVVDTDGETLNVRSAPSPSAEIVDELAASTWYVEATGNVADIGDTRWREVSLATGETGWAHGGFLEATSPTCTGAVVTDIYEEQSWEGNLDGDGLTDVATYLLGFNGLAHVRVEFGNGAVTEQQVAEFGAANVGKTQGAVVVLDINGDGFDEIRFDSYFVDRDEVRFITMNGCGFEVHEKPFFRNFGSGGDQGYACKDFGTADAEFFDLIVAADGSIIRAFANSFDPATGFTGTDELTGMTSQEMADYFDPECTTDYD